MPGAIGARWVLVTSICSLALLACTGESPGAQDVPSPRSSSSDASGAGTETPTPERHRHESEGDADQPLVIAVHHTSALRAVSLRRACRIAVGESDLRVTTGRPQAALRAVVRDPATVAVVPAHAVGPQVRVLSVAGMDPLRVPRRYPLRAPASEPPGPVTTVTVVGDIMLGRGVAEAARGSGDPAPALRPTARRLARADVTVGNLENTLSRAGAPTQGGDSFAADPAVVGALREAGFDVLGLANNHLGDYGDRALVQTVRRLNTGGIATFGAGATVSRAWRPAVVERDGVRFGFLGFNAIGESPDVALGQPGVVSVDMPPRTGPLDEAALRRFEASLRRLGRRVDVVVAMPHWGTQYTNRPEPIQSRVARRLVRAGADVVVGGHPHWLQGVEIVRGRLVAHSLGNFVFDMDFMRETQEGAVLEMTFWGAELKAAEFVPYVMDDRFAPRFVSGRRAEQVLAVMRATSGPAHSG